jgi:hypothetical protein
MNINRYSGLFFLPRAGIRAEATSKTLAGVSVS